MPWVIPAIGLAVAGLMLSNSVILQRRRGEFAGWTPWASAVILSRVFLLLPFLALLVTFGQWPGFAFLTWWFALAAVFMLVADTGDRMTVAKAVRARRNPPRLD